VHRYAARPLRHAAGFLCLYLIWGEHTVAGLLGSGEMNGGSALQKLSLEKQSVLDEADLLLSDEEDYSEDTSVELGGICDSCMSYIHVLQPCSVWASECLMLCRIDDNRRASSHLCG